METLPPSDAERASFLDNLADQFFVPNGASLQELSDELLAISRARFQLFVERTLEAGGQLVAGAVEDLIREFVKTVAQWAEDLNSAIKTLVDAIANLDRQIEALVSQAQQAFAQATDKLDLLLQQFASQTFRDAFRQAIATETFRRAKAILANIPLYRSLPAAARQSVRGVLQNVIDDLIEGPLLNPAFDAIGAASSQIDGMLQDIQALNPNEPLAPQLLDLVLDRFEDQITQVFGGTNPRINVGFDAGLFGFSQHFTLATIELPLSTVFTMLRDVVAGLTFYEGALTAAAASLAAAFAKSIDLKSKKDERTTKAADHARLSRIRAEFTSTPKAIAVINPVQSLVYDDDVEVRIRLGRVPASYLGLGDDEQQRVLIFLNGSLIPPQGLVSGNPFGSLDAKNLTQTINVAALPGFDAPTRSISAGNARLTLYQPAADPAQDSPVGGAIQNVGVLRASPVSRASSAISQPLIRQSVAAGQGGNSVVTSAVKNILPGRRMTSSKSAALEESLPAGTTIEFRASRANLLAGTNTLIVVVVDPDGIRYQQIVSFGVTTTPVRTDGAKLPSVVEQPPDDQPASTRSTLDLQFDRAALAQRLKQGKAFLARHAALQLQAFRG
jgi:hypothetical protein